MFAKLEELNKDFRIKVIDLILACGKRGVTVVPFCTNRDLFEQARLWRQSRSGIEINNKICDLKRDGAYFLVYLIRVVGAQNGPWVTFAIPGLSWHQYGAAVDCCIVENGNPVWDTAHKGYKIYREEGLKLGMYIGVAGDWCHLQASNKLVFGDYGSMPNINNIMLIKHVKDVCDMVSEL